MNKSESIAELATALSKAQPELENAIRDVAAHKYKYADLGQMLTITKPVFAKYDLALSQFPSGGEGDSISLDSILMHKSGEWLSQSYSMPIEARGISKAQASGLTITYMRRYALAAIAGITQEDNDAAAHREEQKNIDMHAEENNAAVAEFKRKMSSCDTFDKLQNVFAIAYEWARDNNDGKAGAEIQKTYKDVKTISGWGVKNVKEGD